ncbi:MAG: DUF2950 domain-containing protein [Rhodospirillales bacterium]
MSARMHHTVPVIRRLARAVFFLAAALLLVTAAARPTAASAPAAAPAYPTPEAALDAFRAAVNGENGKGVIDLFGKQYEADLIGGDPAEARQNIDVLRRLAAQGMTLQPDGDDRMTIVMGRRGWPMPIPLVKGEQGWTFDIKSGLQEITDRRVGRNELAAIDFCKAYIDAQRRYASTDEDGDGVLEFAQRLKSSEGKRDGLYWPPGPDGVASPLGPFAAAAEPYLKGRKEGEPFRGYYFRILKEQGANAPGGKYNYVINGNMIAGFALIAWPADYRRSGIMTFQCGHNGAILEKDLGPETAKIASAITAYDPDKTWAPADTE